MTPRDSVRPCATLCCHSSPAGPYLHADGTEGPQGPSAVTYAGQRNQSGGGPLAILDQNKTVAVFFWHAGKGPPTPQLYFSAVNTPQLEMLMATESHVLPQMGSIESDV